MSHSNGKITAPINLAGDVMPLLASVLLVMVMN